MTRFLWPLSVLIICLPVAILATGVPLPFLHRPPGLPRPLPVPSGDQELAWFHTTTSGHTWERFVAGMSRAQLLVPGLRVDDSAAFVDETTATPEVILSIEGHPGRLRVRWYKLTNEANAARWVEALAERDPAPLAVIGGGSSDRAVDLARAMDARQIWHGDRPLLLITTATADEVVIDPDDDRVTPPAAPTRNLMDVYRGRTFRFCFTNRQMADAVLDFIWNTPGLRPEMFSSLVPAAVGSGLIIWSEGTLPAKQKPQVYNIYWQDDPFSVDLHDQFKVLLSRKFGPPGADPMHAADGPHAQFSTWSIPSSIGGFVRPNQAEALVAESILQEFRELPPQRSLLVLPTITQPARRLLRTLAESTPQLGQRLVAVTGDGIPVNDLYRDGDLRWPVHAIPVPLVLFTHNDPVGWDDPDRIPPPPTGYELRPPTSTEDVLHFAELIRVVTEACYSSPDLHGLVTPGDGLLARADHLSDRLHGRCPPFFDADGNRLGGTGEYVVALWPQVEDGNAGPRTLPQAMMEVWRRADDGRWEHVKTIEIDQRRTRAATPIRGGRRG
jgi:hypothetical protein